MTDIQFDRGFDGAKLRHLLFKHNADDAVFISLSDTSGILQEIVLHHSSVKLSTHTLTYGHLGFNCNGDS